MFTRRRFLESLVAAGAAVPALRDHALARVVSANQAVAGRSPDDVAQDEDFWLDVQQAFTLDRTIINLNNGGVSPSPRVVQEAMRRYPEYSNTAPVHTTGQIFPIRKIVRLARDRGIEVIVDGAHAYAHFPFTRDELECDYYGTSLHKWLLAPHGTGFLYVRKAKIERLWPLMAAPPEMNGDIRKFEEIGTHPAANHNAIAEALTFHEGLRPERKAARLRYLFQRWAKRLGAQPQVGILTPYDAAQSCGLASFSVEGLEDRKSVV